MTAKRPDHWTNSGLPASDASGGTTAPGSTTDREAVTTSSGRDWPEDFSHENGDYMNFCCYCKQTFIGYKRRVVCKVCPVLQHRQGEKCGHSQPSGDKQ